MATKSDRAVCKWYAARAAESVRLIAIQGAVDLHTMHTIKSDSVGLRRGF